MSLSRKIAGALDAGPAPGPLEVRDGAHRLQLHVSAAGSVGVAFDALEFSATDRTSWSSAALKEWADRLAGRVTYLMEPLVVLEVDAVGGEVELRSGAPTAREGQRFYYEVRLSQAGSLRLTRVAYDPEARRRRPVACQMTREAIERLADDLVASVE
jgi:hypothetical protein